MAKKKQASEPKLKRLTDEQIGELSKRLLGTTANIYTIARSMGCEAGDETFDRLKAAGTQRCEECDEWKLAGEEFNRGLETCNECLNRIDGGEK